MECINVHLNAVFMPIKGLILLSLTSVQQDKAIGATCGFWQVVDEVLVWTPDIGANFEQLSAFNIH